MDICMCYLYSIFSNIKKIDLKPKIILCLTLIIFTYKSNLFSGNPGVLMFSLFMFLGKELYKIFNYTDISYKNLLSLTLILNLMIWFKSKRGILNNNFCFNIVIFKNNNFKILLFLSITCLISVKVLFYNYWELSLNPNQSLFSSNF